MKKITLLTLCSLLVITTYAQLIVATGSLASARMFHKSQLLSNGKVVAFGGYDGYVSSPKTYKSAEIYNPGLGTWTSTGSMLKARELATSVLLTNGNIMVIGGDDGNINLASCEIYNVTNGTWSYADSMKNKRREAKAIVLNNGTILVVGGYAEMTCELYDQTNNKWTVTDTLKTNRSGGFNAVKLPNGNVLVVGGQSDVAEVYDVASGKWSTLTNTTTEARDYCNAILMSNNKVLIAGGNFTMTSEIFDPVLNTFTSAGDLLVGASGCEMINLTNGNVLIFGIGDVFSDPTDIKCLQVFNPAANSWYSAGKISGIGVNSYTVHKLQTGKILYVAGNWSTGNGASEKCYLVTESAIAVGIESVSANNYFDFYPNPTDGKFTLETANLSSKVSEISIYDLTGQLIYAENIEQSSSSPYFKKEFDLTNFSKGLYNIRISNEDGTLFKKIIVE